MEFNWPCTYGDYFSSPEKFEAIEEYISFTGAHIKNLIIWYVKVDQKIVQKLLDLLPNLESLELSEVEWVNQEQSIKLVLKSTKIELFTFDGCTGLGNLLESLEKCAIKFYCRTDKGSETIKKFLKVQEKNLKKLTISDYPDLLNDLKELRLEHLVFVCGGWGSLEFLGRQDNLRVLKLTIWNFLDEHLNMIWDLKNLETLELDGSVNDESSLNDIQKLQKLKCLKISSGMSLNILDHLQFGVFHDLEELDACFEGASLDLIRKMNQITPKLKKIEIRCDSSDTVNALLENLENLKSVTIGDDCKNWIVPSEKFYPKVKCLDVPTLNNPNAEQITKTFPNLETMKIYTCYLVEPILFLITLLNELKQLKTLRLGTQSHLVLDRESALECFQQHGKHLEDVYVRFNSFFSENVRLFVIKRPGKSFLFCISAENLVVNM
jgi:hypothetical protein